MRPGWLEKLIVRNVDSVERYVLQKGSLGSDSRSFLDLGEGRGSLCAADLRLCILYNSAFSEVNVVSNTRYQHFLNYLAASFYSYT